MVVVGASSIARGGNPDALLSARSFVCKMDVLNLDDFYVTKYTQILLNDIRHFRSRDSDPSL